MLLQTNSYIVPKERRSEHARLMRRFRQVLGRLGCDDFEVYEQTGPNWTGAAEGSQRFVQIMRFRDRKHHAALQAAERGDAAAQQLIAEFCEMVNFPYQQQHGFFAVGFYTSLLQPAGARGGQEGATEELPGEGGEATPDETQAYAAEELAESQEPGHLAEGEGPAEVGENAPFGQAPLMAAEPSVDPEQPVVEPPSQEAQEPPATGRRRKKATG